jgi:SM-20-related protein
LNITESVTQTIYDQIADALVEDGYIILENFLPTELAQQLYQHVSTLAKQEFKPAGIGRNNNLHLNQEIRNDQIRWLSDEIPSEHTYLAIMDECRRQLNRKLFLGLHDYEAHFAHYASGSYYQRHIDAFKGQSNRVVTTVFYLNPEWTQHDEGELLIYHPDSEDILCRISPKFGKTVIFLSERFPHEVLAATRDRYSIAGWFRIDGQS